MKNLKRRRPRSRHCMRCVRLEPLPLVLSEGVDVSERRGGLYERVMYLHFWVQENWIVSIRTDID